MNKNFKRTKAGIKICPFFGWTSENIEGAGRQEENDVNLTICSHEQNPNQYEGNCQESFCPLLQREKPKMTLTPNQFEILDYTEHRAANKQFRGDSEDMQELVAMGLMIPIGKKSFAPDEYFQITGKGQAALRG